MKKEVCICNDPIGKLICLVHTKQGFNVKKGGKKNEKV